jgi:SAM-dependent methyltransferase
MADEATGSVEKGEERQLTRRLVEKAFAKMAQNRPPGQGHPLEGELSSFHEALSVGIGSDKVGTQEAVARYCESDEPAERFLADYAFSLPEMATDDMEVVTGPSGGMEISYWGRQVRIDPPIVGAARAREVLCGLAVLIEDAEGRPLSLLHLNLLGAEPGEPTTGIACTPEEFNQRFYYGEPVSLERIKAYLDDQTFRRSINDSGFNPAVLPLYGLVRLRELVQDPERGQAARRLLKLFSGEQRFSLALFQILGDEDLTDGLKMVDWLEKGKLAPLAGIMLEAALLVSDFAPGLAGENVVEETEAIRLIESKVKQQLLEAIGLFKTERDSLTPEDWQIIAFSQRALAFAAQASVSLAEGRSLEGLREIKMPPKFVLELFDFAGRFPEAKITFQSFFDFALAIQIANQESAPYAGNIAEMKRKFYREYNEASSMDEQTETAETPLEVARFKNLILGERLPAKPRILFAGCGKAQRFEARLIRELGAGGFDPGDILGVDLEEYSADIPADLGMRFRRGDLSERGFLEDEGQFDVVIVPWSMLSDVVEKKKLLELMQKLSRLVKPRGVMIVDLPAPIGTHSYAQELAKQADLWKVWGLMERDFQGSAGATVRSIFDILDVRDACMHFIHAGFIPENFPLALDAQWTLLQKIDADDSLLTRQHETGADRDAAANPIWQTSKGYNRVTFLCRQVGQEEVQRLSGFMPSLLVARAFSAGKGG